MSASSPNPTRLVAIVGPTASGKARLAVAAARARGAILLSCDSMKVYRRMDVGTAKPPPELREDVDWRGLDLVEPWEAYHAHRFAELFAAVLAEARAAGRPLILSGGTTLYLKAALEGLAPMPPRDEALRQRLRDEAGAQPPGWLHTRLRQIDPASAERLHPNDAQRIVRALEVEALTGRPLSSFHRETPAPRTDLDPRVFVLSRARPDVHARIEARIDRMLAAGWVEETRRLRADPRGLSREASQALGYKQLLAWLAETASTGDPPAELVEKIKTETRRFSRRQMTWLRGPWVQGLAGVHEITLGPGDDPRTQLDRVLAAI